MNVMKILGTVLTVSMVSGAVASAHTVHAPQTPDLSLPSEGNIVASTTTEPSYKGKLRAETGARQPTRPLAFADFGQRDEAGTEN
jgi:hypothetical protein